MAQQSAGLLMYRIRNGTPEYFLVHPGGPFYARKDDGAWTIPKGLSDPDEALLDAAKREFAEETGLPTAGEFVPLGFIKMKSGKIVHAWMFAGSWDDSSGISSNTFPLEWPPKSGKIIEVPEADKGGWFDFETAVVKINSNQKPFLIRARDILEANPKKQH